MIDLPGAANLRVRHEKEYSIQQNGIVLVTRVWELTNIGTRPLLGLWRFTPNIEVDSENLTRLEPLTENLKIESMEASAGKTKFRVVLLIDELGAHMKIRASLRYRCSDITRYFESAGVRHFNDSSEFRKLPKIPSMEEGGRLLPELRVASPFEYNVRIVADRQVKKHGFPFSFEAASGASTGSPKSGIADTRNPYYEWEFGLQPGGWSKDVGVLLGVRELVSPQTVLERIALVLAYGMVASVIIISLGWALGRIEGEYASPTIIALLGASGISALGKLLSVKYRKEQEATDN